MTSRGQVTIPTEIREKLQLSGGNKLEFLLKDGCIVILPINKSLRNLKGILPKPNTALTCQEMNEITQNIGKL
jgi:AbrB family looped-hinge helix DNA binding protein